MKQAVIFSILIVLSNICRDMQASFTNFHIRKIEVCNKTQGPVIIDIDVVTDQKNEQQYLNLNVTYPFSIGENINFLCLIQRKIIGNNYVDLHTVREKNTCKAFNKYLGEFWYDIQRQSLMTPGLCPIQQGTYHGHHIMLQFEKISLQTFPFGTLRFTMEGIEKTNNRSVWCLFVEVDNIIN